MWPFIHSILLRYLHGFATGVEFAVRIFDCLLEKNLSEITWNSIGYHDSRVHDWCGPMAFGGRRSLLEKSSIRDLFSKETSHCLLSTNGFCAQHGLSVESCRQKRVGVPAPDRWFLSPRIRGQLNDSGTNAADPDLLDSGVCNHNRFFQAHGKKTKGQA